MMKLFWRRRGLWSGARRSAPSAGSAEGLGPTLQRIKDAGAITIGHREASVPLSYLDDNQKPIGFSVELCGLVVAKVKAKLGLPESQGRLSGRQLLQPYSAGQERHGRYRMRFDRQHHHAPERGCVLPDLLCAAVQVDRAEIIGPEDDRRPQGQIRRRHPGHQYVAVCRQAQRRQGARHENPARQGSRRILPAGPDRTGVGLHGGRHPAGRTEGERERTR